jgi:hypothetical protein
MALLIEAPFFTSILPIKWPRVLNTWKEPEVVTRALAMTMAVVELDDWVSEELLDEVITELLDDVLPM